MPIVPGRMAISVTVPRDLHAQEDACWEQWNAMEDTVGKLENGDDCHVAIWWFSVAPQIFSKVLNLKKFMSGFLIENLKGLKFLYLLR